MAERATNSSAWFVQGVYSLASGNWPGMALPFLVWGISCGEPATAAFTPAMHAPAAWVNSRTRVPSLWMVMSPTSVDLPAMRLIGPDDAPLGRAVTSANVASPTRASEDTTRLDMASDFGPPPEASVNQS